MSSSKKPKIAVVGATGNVGREVLDIIDEKEIQYSDLIALASSRSKGSTIDYGENKSVVVGDLAEYDFSDTDIAIFSPGAKISSEFAPKAAKQGCIVIDNSSKSINNEIKKMINKDSIVLLNKSDVQNKQNHKFDAETVLASVKENKNIDSLIKKIKEKLSNKFTSNNTALITRERHRIKLNECLKEIDNFLKKDQNKDLELAAEDLRMATRHLGNIVGKVDVEEILGSIFKDFCIGK